MFFEFVDVCLVYDYQVLWFMVECCGVKLFGDLQVGEFWWFVNCMEVLVCFDVFIEQMLLYFGDFEDVMSSSYQWLFYLLLLFFFNVKMLNLCEVIVCVEVVYWYGRVLLFVVEGFVCQILGWREYVCGIYWVQMFGYVLCNVLNYDVLLLLWFWSGKMQMCCL